MPDRPSSSRATPNLRLLFGLVASLLGLALVGTGVSDPLLIAAPGARFAASRTPATTASANTPTAAALAIRPLVFIARRDLVLDDADPHDALPRTTILRSTPLERPAGHNAVAGSCLALPVFWLPPPPGLTDQLSPQNELTLEAASLTWPAGRLMSSRHWALHAPRLQEPLTREPSTPAACVRATAPDLRHMLSHMADQSRRGYPAFLGPCPCPVREQLGLLTTE